MEVATLRKITDRPKPAGRRKTIATLAALAGATALTFGALPMSSAGADRSAAEVGSCGSCPDAANKET
jgi:hypothetical protein